METNTNIEQSPTPQQRAETLVNTEVKSELISHITNLITELDISKTRLEHAQETQNSWKESCWKSERAIGKLRETVRDYFKGELAGDKDGKVVMDIDEINSLLSDIGANDITFTYSARVTVTFNISGVEADDEDDVIEKVRYGTDITISGVDYSSTDEVEVEVEDVEEE